MKPKKHKKLATIRVSDFNYFQTTFIAYMHLLIGLIFIFNDLISFGVASLAFALFFQMFAVYFLLSKKYQERVDYE